MDAVETYDGERMERRAMLVALIATLVVLVGVEETRELGLVDSSGHRYAESQIRNFGIALVSYRLALKAYPEHLDQLIHNPERPFLDAKEIPLDPWGRAYRYATDGQEATIVCYGADGVEGGDGENADIRSDEVMLTTR